ncbi:carboxyl transferase domain-containing protein [Zavarzinia sp. CC-PAN008]|uniref:carboxyl transferase domain-containing protein n=1 Tax=Zavarzinia sp. CC-PAN008 TaxID=3243332 RepID=UPI003F748821
MTIRHVLIANRGEIAIRIARAAGELGLRTTAIHSEDDARSLHVRIADSAVALKGSGASAYLDIGQVVAAAKEAGADAVHPGYGFLAENAAFAQACTDAGLVFIGPRPDVLDLFGDKAKARALAGKVGVPLLQGSIGAASLEEVKAFMGELGPGGAVMIKAVAGGGGRGMRAVTDPAQLDEAYARCQSEAKASFGNGDVFVERYLPRARHVEIQVIGDGTGAVSHVWERECTIQRRNQKIVEVAPSPTLSPAVRDALAAAAVRLAQAARYDSLGTFEFLVDAASPGEDGFFFIEANPRLQVEHTVTEQVTDIDLVKSQIRIAGGATLESLGLTQGQIPKPRGHAIQLRINMETMDATGAARPSGGLLAAFEPPTGPGIRVDTFGYAGYVTSPNFDSLLAKVIAHSASPDYGDAVARALRALGEFRIEGVATNLPFLSVLLRHPDVAANRVTTRFIEDHAAELVAAIPDLPRRVFADVAAPDSTLPRDIPMADAPEDSVGVPAPLQGKVVAIDVKVGDTVRAGQAVAVLEAMKMEHVVEATVGGVVSLVAVDPGDVLFEGQALLFVTPADVAGAEALAAEEIDLDAIRPDLAEVIERHRITLDEARPDAVARRRKTGQRTARENVNDLVDPGTFIEYGALTLAAQRRRRSLEELLRMSPADGLVVGIGSVNGDKFDDEQSRTAVMSYDYTVLAGTQGMNNHKKTDRFLRVVEQNRLPFVLFAEGGGGRPGDTDALGSAGLDVMTFYEFARLSAMMPRLGVVSGYCFAGNAALLGCCDTIIATKKSYIGMGGPAMIEGGGLGVYKPTEVGPVEDQVPNGVIDLLVEDEAEAVAASKQYLSYFQGAVKDWTAADQRLLRRAIPENRLRVYDVRQVIETLADTGSVMELRREFGIGILTCFVRIEGRPFGLIANNPMHLGGAIDAPAGDKAARFIQLCDAFDIPMISLCDTPGFMVGPEVEKTAQVRRVSRMFVAAATASVPIFTIVLRKGYGLGAQAMAGGSFHAPFFIASWPTGEFGGMGLEGAVRLGYRNELAALTDPVERDALYRKLLDKLYENGKAINMAAFLEIDAVIDPLETRRWIMRGLRSVPKRPLPPEGKRRPFVDTY